MISFKHAETGEERSFTVSEFTNELRSLLVFLSEISDSTMIGFNNIGYDYPVIEPLLSNWKHIWDKYRNHALGLCQYMYRRSVDIIETEGDEWYEKYYYKEFVIKQIDLYRIYHLNNKNRQSTSLKWVEFVLDHDKLQTFEFDPHKMVASDQIAEILEYNLNDVRATLTFWNHAQKQGKIDYRKEFGEVEGLNFTNLSDTSIAKKLFAKYLTDAMGIGYWDLKKLKTPRPYINFSDIVFDYVEFETPLFNGLLETIKKTRYKPGDDTFKLTVEHCGLHFDYGVGGLHAYPKKWLYDRSGRRLVKPESIPQDDRADDSTYIIHVDVSSYYPNIAINNRLKPEHLGEEFVQIYKDFYDRRYEAKRQGDYFVEQAMKLSLNSVFGLSKEVHSYFYDPQFTFAITINGQLLLTMLAEKMCLANITLLQCNTDGIYVKIRQGQLGLLTDICNRWSDLTGLNLDFDYYHRLCQRDVNNYIGLTSNGKVKYKGAFRINKDIHEDSSMRIVPMALEQFLLFDKDYREFVRETREIEPFLMGTRIKRQDSVEERYLDETKTKIIRNCFHKAVRYVVSASGNPLYKQFGISGKDQKILDGFKCKIANDLSTVKREDVDERFYISEIEKITSLFQRQQLKLF